jgi:response regulator of citrate/malate metabolism
LKYDNYYSSLESVFEANAKMSQNMIDTIMKFSDDKGHDSDGYPVVQLKTLQLVYDQMRHDEMDMLCTEKIGLEVPLLSIIPLCRK